MATTTETYLTPSEAAPLVRLSPTRVRKEVAARRLRAIKRGTRILIPASAIPAYFESFPAAGPPAPTPAPVPTPTKRAPRAKVHGDFF